MTEREAEESAEVEARWKEFWADHKDYDPSWVPEFLGELREDLPFVFGNSAYEAFVLMYERNGVELPKGPPDVASYHPQLTPRELYKLPIGQFAFGVRAYAYYGVWPHWLDSPDRDFGEYLSAFGRGMFAAGWSLFGNETPDDNDIDDRRAIIAAFARQKLDPPIDYGLTPDELAALARVSRKSIMNLLAPGSGGILQLDTEKLITPESASRWLLGRADFRPSIWEKQKGKSTWRPGSESSSIGEPLFVPVARDGSWFAPTDRNQADGQYHVGNGTEELTFKDYGAALEFLSRATSPRWRYTDTIGRWRTKTATGWERKPRREVISDSPEAKQNSGNRRHK